MKQILNSTALAFACLLGLASTASAQLIAWEESVGMFDTSLPDPNVQTFVDTTGSLAVGFNATADTGLNDDGSVRANVVVNTVPFTGTQIGSTLGGPGNETITINGGVDNTNAFGDGNFNGDGQIFNLIRGARFEVQSVTLGGLEIGQDYLIQAFTHDGRGSRNQNSVVGFGDGSGSVEPVATSLLSNLVPGAITDPADPNFDPEAAIQVGDSIIGTFTADSDTLTFNIFGSEDGGDNFGTENSQSQINAIQLRRVEDVEVLRGDANCDGFVNFADIGPFIGFLSSGEFKAEADVDGSGVIDFADIGPFISALSSS